MASFRVNQVTIKQSLVILNKTDKFAPVQNQSILLNMAQILQIVFIVFAMQLIKVDLMWNNVDARAATKVDLNDPFYKGQIDYDATLTDTPIGTIVYGVDDDALSSARAKSFQLQDVVTHGNVYDKSFMNPNLFTIGDQNDRMLDDGSDEDYMDDVTDIDELSYRSTQRKFGKFPFSNSKPIMDRSMDSSAQPKQAKNKTAATTVERNLHQPQTANNAADLPNRQKTYNHSSETSSIRANAQRHHSHKLNQKGNAYGRQNQLRQVYEHNRHRSRLRSGMEPHSQSFRPHMHAYVRFYDYSYDGSLDSNRGPSTFNYRSDNRWSHLKKLRNRLYEDKLRELIPLHVQKYNGRNKQLVGLLAGNGEAVDELHMQPTRSNEKQQDQWIDKDLFQDQRNGKKKVTVNKPKHTTEDSHVVPSISSEYRFLIEKHLRSEANGLPGEHLSLTSMQRNACDLDCKNAQSSAGATQNTEKPSPRIRNFEFRLGLDNIMHVYAKQSLNKTNHNTINTERIPLPSTPATLDPMNQN